jgi:hypothetical protein
MAIVESKLKVGKLTLGGTPPVSPPGPPTGGTEFSCQATNVRIVPTFNDAGDPVETLCGDKLTADTTTDWALQGTSIQDFDSPDGFIEYSWTNNLLNVPFVWQPNETANMYYGTVQVRALEVGGDVNARITTDFEWPIQGMPDVTWVTAGTQEAPAEEEAEPQEEDEEEVYQEEQPEPTGPGETTTYSTS